MSTPHFCMKYIVGGRVGVIRADMHVAHQYYEESLKVGYRIPIQESEQDKSDECKVSFERMKIMLATLPILSKPSPSKPIIVYLSISNEAVSTTIFQEWDKE
ncbi:hypothetical protein CR513_26937, partial [Mucuna pruriens]